MADNLTVSIGIDTKKLQADIKLAEAQLKGLGTAMKAATAEANKTGDRTRVDQLSAAYDTLNRALIQNQRAQRETNKMLAGHGAAAHGAAQGLHELAGAHAEAAEASRGNSREIIKISKELGTLEVNGFGVAKMLREFPKVAIPVAVVAGVTAAVSKLSNEAYKNVTALDDLSKASGFAKSQIIGLEKTFGAADVGGDVLEKMLRSVGKTFDEAKSKSTDFAGAMSGVNVGRGPGRGIDDAHGPPYTAEGHGPGSRATQSITPGLSDYQAPPHIMVSPTMQRPGTGGQVQSGTGFDAGTGVLVMRGGQPSNIDPSKGFASLVDAKLFKTQAEFLAALRRALLNIAEKFPELAREIIRAQGLDPEDTLRGLRGSSAEDLRKFRESTLSDPRLREGTLPLARQFGAESKEAGERGERTATEAGIPAMELAIPILKQYGEALDAIGEHIKQTRGEADKFNAALTKGADSGELGAATNSFAAAWTGAFGTIQNSWRATVDYMNSLQPTLPGGGGSQAGQVIPIAPAPGGMATGGIVSGRGTGDTVPAWLTPGEYVNRRASVAYYGSSLFSALNNRAIPRNLFSRIGYASGGLVGDIASFAEGGAVRGGTPVHLHLDGQSFATSATESVAGALVVAARRQQMRSAGVKPSWYGGRPGA